MSSCALAFTYLPILLLYGYIHICISIWPCACICDWITDRWFVLLCSMLACSAIISRWGVIFAPHHPLPYHIISHHTLLHHITPYRITSYLTHRDRRSSRGDTRPPTGKEKERERETETENTRLPPPPLNSPCGHSEFPSPSSLLYYRCVFWLMDSSAADLYHNVPYPVVSQPVLSYLILQYPKNHTLSHHIIWYQIQSCRISSYPKTLYDCNSLDFTFTILLYLAWH